MWRLPQWTGERLLTTARRALTRRCPYCGHTGIYDGYLALRESCPACGVRFEREEGYFLGAYALNLIVAEFLGLGLAVFLLFRTDLRRLDLIWQEAIAVLLAVAFPVIFFPYSRTLWIALDGTLHPPGADPERQLQGPQGSRSQR
ncbi:MAG: DUF983 domain-containing protein [Chloroflexia bacterium]|nr:DUF983 domain-containing protein [Chloroflexia bacterium]